MSEHDYPAQGEQPAETGAAMVDETADTDEQDGDAEQADADAAAQDEDQATADEAAAQ